MERKSTRRQFLQAACAATALIRDVPAFAQQSEVDWNLQFQWGAIERKFTERKLDLQGQLGAVMEHADEFLSQERNSYSHFYAAPLLAITEHLLDPKNCGQLPNQEKKQEWLEAYTSHVMPSVESSDESLKKLAQEHKKLAQELLKKLEKKPGIPMCLS